MLSQEHMQQLIRQHQDSVRQGIFLRNLQKRQVTRITDADGVRWIVKGYRLHLLQKWLRIFPSFHKNSQVLGDLTVPCEGFLVERGWYYLFTRDAGEFDLYAFQKLRESGMDPLPLFRTAGEILGKIHCRKLYHADTKTPNFICNTLLPNLPKVLIIDCDRLKYYSAGLPLEKAAFNIAQFLASLQMPRDLAIELGNQFLSGYFSTAGNHESRSREQLMHQVRETLLHGKKLEIALMDSSLQTYPWE